MARGRHLVAPEGRSTRPTGDRVREAVFNALGSLGAVDGATVLDLFAGSGALGIEALSRGAAHATFVDGDRAAVAAVRANLERTGLAGSATVEASDAWAWLLRARGPFDLVLLDPPYETDRWPDLLARVVPLLAPDGVVVAESGRPVEPVRGLVTLREKRYGGTVVSFARRVEPTPSPLGDLE